MLKETAEHAFLGFRFGWPFVVKFIGFSSRFPFSAFSFFLSATHPFLFSREIS